ncbi:TetR/AcrR family transcriptional regulator [Pelagibacterium xiamenense]|uniref:TetR/AcrR family transcriptional regulator n=1 Tax=Pelagibacterium xiamenense TaxID=2901140 RepID=UPI001E592B34|nr:TetR/AcrR family transcriptional regulator [Pelagibacterium xiamenense]MCD7059579.1 TetR family transcriptional regulator [Pelagibacterium xiamenense]
MSEDSVAGSAGERPKPAKRVNDPEGKRRDIIEVASREFARNGLAGARIDEIAAQTKASKRMIYYYFGDKEGLYLHCLEGAYRDVREGEARLDLADLDPVNALRALVGFTFDHHSQSENFIRMVMIENIHNGEFVRSATGLQKLNAAAHQRLADLIERGEAAGLYRPGLVAIELHWQISALCFFHISNRATFSELFKHDLYSPEVVNRTRSNCIDMVLRYALRPEVLIRLGL